MSDSKETHQVNRKKAWLESVTSLSLALILVFGVRSCIIEPFKIPSGSMIPTLLIGDHIFVNKMAYGFKLPFLDDRIPFTDFRMMDKPVYLYKRQGPSRGDIVVFIFPKDESFFYIKRVVGIPGDTIEVRDKVIYVNGKATERVAITGDPAEAVYSKLDDPRYSRQNLALFKEKLGEVDHTIMLSKDSFLVESYPPTKVPEDSLFVMGDNRDFSNDSRFWGFVPMKNVRGKAMVIWLSLWFTPEDWKFTFRPERIGTVLQ